MTQVSRLPLPKGLEAQMYALFRRVLADLHNDKDIENFLEDLLTPTEKIMLGKRLAIAFLLEQGYDQRTIHTIMKVSLGTVNSVSLWLHYKGQGYRKVIQKVREAQKWGDFIEQIDERLRRALSRKTIASTLYLPDDEHKKRNLRL